MTTEYSIQKMVSDGTLSTIALGIQYLQRNDIYMRIAGEETPQSGAPSGYTWSFVDNTTLKILPVVPNGVEVVVYRRTDVDAMYNIYSQNAQFDEATIDENNQQLLYIAQEYLEQGLPGAGVDTLEYVRDDGSFTYYRMRRTDGSYSEEFPVPSASNSTKVLTRESLRRSYAAAGYHLVDGSFEVGGTLVNANDALLQERTGKAFSGPAGVVSARTDPTSGGFKDRSFDIVWDLPNYAAIRAYSGSATKIHCQGRVGPFDGGGGKFYLDSSDTASSDNDGDIIIDALGRRWKRESIDCHAVRAEWFGCGTNDVALDSAGLRKAIIAANGRPIIVNRDMMLSNVDVTCANSKFILVADNSFHAFKGKIKITTPLGSPCIFKGAAHTETISGFDFVCLGNRNDGVGTVVFNNLASNGTWVNISNFSISGFSGSALTALDTIHSKFENGYVTGCDISITVDTKDWPASTTTTFDNVYIERCKVGLRLRNVGRSTLRNMIIEHCDWLGEFANCPVITRDTCYFENNTNVTFAVDCLFTVINEFTYHDADIIRETYVNNNQYERGSTKIGPVGIFPERIMANYTQLRRIETTSGGIYSIGKFYREASIHTLTINVLGGSAANAAEIFGECKLDLYAYGNAFGQIVTKRTKTANSAVSRAFAVQVDYNTVEIVIELRQYASMPILDVKVSDKSLFIMDIKPSTVPTVNFLEFI